MTVAYSLWQILFRNIFWNVELPTTLLCQDRLAQSVEDKVLNPKVEGSTPPRAGFARREKSALVKIEAVAPFEDSLSSLK